MHKPYLQFSQPCAVHCVSDPCRPCSPVAIQTGSASQGTQLARLSLHSCCVDNPHILQGRVNKHGLCESLCIPRMESVKSFSKTHSYCKKSKITLLGFFLTSSGCGCDQPWHLSNVASNKTICPMKPCLNSCYHKYDSKRFKSHLQSFIWQTLWLCCINCWQSQGPDTCLEVAFLAFFFFSVLVTY